MKTKNFEICTNDTTTLARVFEYSVSRLFNVSVRKEHKGFYNLTVKIDAVLFDDVRPELFAIVNDARRERMLND